MAAITADSVAINAILKLSPSMQHEPIYVPYEGSIMVVNHY